MPSASNGDVVRVGGAVSDCSDTMGVSVSLPNTGTPFPSVEVNNVEVLESKDVVLFALKGTR